MTHSAALSPPTGSFSSSDRILKRHQFEELQDSGKKLYTKFFLLSLKVKEHGPSRLGITITKRVAPNATERNRVKRRAREFFRRHRTKLTQPVDMVIIARRDAQNCSFEEMTSALLEALYRHGYARP